MKRRKYENEIYLEIMKSIDGQVDADKRVALLMRADEIEAAYRDGRDWSRAKRRAVAAALRAEAKVWP